MAITLDTQPNVYSSAYQTLRYKVHSDRDHVITDASVDVADNGGFVRFNTSTTNMYVGDVITGSEFTNTDYNVKSNITAIDDATHCTTDLIWTGASATGRTDRTNSNFKIALALKIVDYSGSVTILEKIYAYEKDGFYYFDVEEILQNYIGYDFKDYIGVGSYTIFVGQQLSVKLVDNSVFTEYFDNAKGKMTVGSTLTQTQDTFIYNTIVQTSEEQNLATNYLIYTTSSIKKFLTDFPDGEKIHKDADLQLSAMVRGSGTSLRFRTKITTFDINNGVLNTYLSADIDPNESYQRRAILYAIKNYYSASNVYKISVRIMNPSTHTSPTSSSSETRIYIIDRKEYKHNIHFYFLNQRGGFDTYSAHFNREENVPFSKERFLKNIGLGFETFDRGWKTMEVSALRKGSIKGDYESAAVLLWLKQLYYSPVVYAYIDSVLIPVNITNKPTSITDELIQPVIEFVYDNNLIIQTN